LQAVARIAEEASTAVLLTGVMLAAFSAALLSLLLALAPDVQMRSIMFWLLGDLAGATDLRAALISLAVLAALLVAAAAQARPLNLLLRGDLQALVLAGAVLVLLADTVARSAMSPLQLPVGVITALIGVPVFISLVRRI
jgi:iron complex transport system permease protein